MEQLHDNGGAVGLYGALTDGGVGRPLKTLDRIASLSWNEVGVCECAESKKIEWSETAKDVWEKIRGVWELGAAATYFSRFLGCTTNQMYCTMVFASLRSPGRTSLHTTPSFRSCEMCSISYPNSSSTCSQTYVIYMSRSCCRRTSSVC
jgi:hypothetical protein